MAKALVNGKEMTSSHYAAAPIAADLCCAGNSCGQPVVFQDAYRRRQRDGYKDVPPGFRLAKGSRHTPACDIDRHAAAQETKIPPKLDSNRVRERLKEQLYALYLNYAFFIKGAVVAVAAITISLILAVHAVPNRHERIALWITSLAFSLVTVATWIRGAVLTNWRANVYDVILPLALGITETLFYIVLSPSIERFAIPLRYWYLVFALHAALAVGLICNRRGQTRLEEYAAEPILENIVIESRHWMMADLVGASGTALFGFGMYIIHDWLAEISASRGVSADMGAAVVLTSLASVIIYNSMKQYTRLGSL